MNWRWLFFDYVDPALGLSRPLRRQVRREAKALVQSEQTRFWFTSIGNPVRPSQLLYLAAALVPSAFVLAVLFWTSVAVSLRVYLVPIQLGSSWFLMAMVGRWFWRPAVIEALRKRGYDVCYRCGYWLRGLDEAVQCPECGRERDQRLPGEPDS